MVDYKEVKKILNSANTSMRYYSKSRRIADNSCFKGTAISAVEDLKALFAHDEKTTLDSAAHSMGYSGVRTLSNVMDTANKLTSSYLTMLSSTTPLKADEIHRAMDSSIFNPAWSIATPADPAFSNITLPNVYLSPYEANSLYSQGGVFETIINKKSLSILLNGAKIENEHLSQKQVDLINERMERLDLKQKIAFALRDSLVYGGAILFPMFKKDRPVTTNLSLSSLIKLGVVGKDCIDYFITLDRWNTVIIPEANPTTKTYYDPEYYTALFLGADVHKSRVARIVTGEQAGYLGHTYTQGWGISDFCGYVQSGMNYKVAVQSLPMMIQQMSILARTVNVDGVLATEGTNILDALVQSNTIRSRRASVDNPVTLDVLGELKSIDRNFQQVPELLRLLRQDFSADAKIPEPMIFSCERSGFGNADESESNTNKQWEAIRMTFKIAENQFKRLAKIVVLDTLGTENDVLDAIPYTKIHFDEPQIASALEKAQIGKNYAETVFNLVSARLPMDIAVEIAQKHLSSDMAVSSGILDEIKEVQKRVDEQDKQRFEMEIEQGKAEAQASSEKADGLKLKSEAAGQNSSKAKYTRLEQKQHEKTNGSSKRSESLSKAAAKKA